MDDLIMANHTPLETLQSNVDDILAPIKFIHGDRYHSILVALFYTASNITQLDDMHCESTAMVRNLAAMQNDEKLVEMASQKHSIGHDIAHESTLGITSLIRILESEFGMKDLQKNFASLLHRIEVDFRNPHG